MLIFSEETTGNYKGSYNDNFVTATNQVVIKPDPKDNIKSIITSKAKQYHIDQELLLKIAECESGFKPDSKNTRSTASGLFQWLDSSFLRYAQAYGFPIEDKNDPEVQSELAARVIADGGIHNWNESKNCWDSYSN